MAKIDRSDKKIKFKMLGEVKSVDISAQRIKVQDIMVILGRRFYDAVKTLGEAQLSPILEFL
jgi:hypothetical protein